MGNRGKFLHPELMFVDTRAVHIYACVGPSAPLTAITHGLDDRTTIRPQSDLSVSTPVLRCCHVYPVRLQIPHDHARCKWLLWSFSSDFSYSTVRCTEVLRVGN